ncbi:MAG: Rpn family recombination-promoting nuclease/putative transposase [Chitinophagales bacterium]
MEYGRIKYDIFFKKVFGQKEHITRAFLNTVLRDDLKSPIDKVAFEPTDFIIKGKNALINSAKHDVIDIFCIDQEGRRILIEIQKGGSKLALPRFLDYQCRNYSSQFIPNDRYKNVVGCYSICWMLDLKPPHDSLSEKIRLCSNETETDWSFDWQITALYPRNLGNLEDLKQQLKKEHDISLAEWLVLDVVTDQEKVATIKDVLQNKEVKEAFEDLDLSGYTEAQIREAAYKAEYGDLVERDRKKLLAKAEKQKTEALAKAKKEAEKKRLEELAKAEKQKAEALQKQKIEMAKSMFDFADLDAISKVTGLSKDVLRKLKRDKT